MRYRVAQIVLIVLGILISVAVLAPTPGLSLAISGYIVGLMVGKILLVILAVLCFIGASGAGKRARKPRSPN